MSYVQDFVTSLFEQPQPNVQKFDYWELLVQTAQSIDREIEKDATYSRNNRQLQAKFDQISTLVSKFEIPIQNQTNIDPAQLDTEYLAAYWTLFYKLDNETIEAKVEVFNQSIKAGGAPFYAAFNNLIKNLFLVRKNLSLVPSTVSITVLPLSKFVDKLFVWSLSIVSDL